MIQTEHVQEMIQEALDIARFLDGKDVMEQVERNGHETTPAMLLSLAMNRLHHAADELDATRLTYFGFQET